jgi:hypothetical protein
MPSLPSYARLKLGSASEKATPIVERSQMERGVPRTRRTATDPLLTLSATLVFRSWADAESFRTWFYSPVGAAAGAAWFDWRDPRTNAMRSVRFVASSMGDVVPLSASFGICEQPCAIEYVLRT